MARRKVKSEATGFERRVGICVLLGHIIAPLTVKGKATIVCFECDAYLNYKATFGQEVADIAARHFSEN